MRVLHVITTINPLFGGPSHGVRNIVYEVKKLGVQADVLSLDSPDEKFILDDSFCHYAIGPWQGPWWYNSKLIPWLKTNILQYDFVVVHGLWLYHTYAVNKVIKQLKDQQSANDAAIKQVPKVFIIPHGMLDPYFQKAQNRLLKAIRNWVYWKLIESNVVNNADGILFTCETELLLAKETFYPYKPKREVNIGYGILEPPAFTEAMRTAFLKKCPELTQEHYLLFLSRIHEKKGVELLINAYADLVKSLNSVKFPKLVIAGPGLETAYGQKMQQLAFDTHKLDKSIYFPGMLTHNTKWGAFYGCEAFILPSHQENFGIVVAEALACKKPVLLSNQVNIWREVKAGKCGFVADDTLEGTNQLLKKWFELPSSDRKVMEDRARVTYEENFSIGPVARRYINTLRS
ncbi:glycosyltransferase [Spirosoma sp. KCTC 42546]|uniref:glycosyltransferase n=1 Tax=Spirosoma sp. KCTC 42546 TaxID=2520506 RepID=UPI00115AE470|nr:glycosyltransferase [Spirosoma sp. KCTC 42546]QDK78669.1 glycosyltransferase [Spirosoma sp. KCTC 42546]